MPIRYMWSNWRFGDDSNRVAAWWIASINGRYFVSQVKPVEEMRDPFEYMRHYHFDLGGCFTLEDFMDRSSSFLMGGPTEADLNEAFAPEKKLALERLEQYMAVAWMKPTLQQLNQAAQIGGAYNKHAGFSLYGPKPVFHIGLPNIYPGSEGPVEKEIRGRMEEGMKKMADSLDNAVSGTGFFKVVPAPLSPAKMAGLTWTGESDE